MLDRDLLWRAYPDGYLAKRGDSTVGGWTCVYVNAPAHNPRIEWARVARPERPDSTEPADSIEAICWLSGVWCGSEGLEASRFVAKRGDLLPDLADPATWALALAELAEAVGLPTGADLTWRRVAEGKWILTRHAADLARALEAFTAAVVQGARVNTALVGGIEPMRDFDLPTTDPVEALLLARVQLREVPP